MRVMLIGGLGYVGSALHPYLASKGHDVTTVDLELRGNRTNPKNMRWDYRMLTRMELERADAIVHLAGHSSVQQCAKDPYAAIKNNLSGIIDLIPRLPGCPFLYASSASVHATNTNTLYDATKRALEALVPQLYPNSYALRFGTVCGPAANLRPDLMLQAMVKSAFTAGVIRVSNPDAKRAILGVPDLCRQVEFILDEARAGGATKAYDLASFSLPIAEIAERAASVLDVPVEEAEGQPTYDFTMEPSQGLPAPECTVQTLVEALVSSYKRGEWA